MPIISTNQPLEKNEQAQSIPTPLVPVVPSAPGISSVSKRPDFLVPGGIMLSPLSITLNKSEGSKLNKNKNLIKV